MLVTCIYRLPWDVLAFLSHHTAARAPCMQASLLAATSIVAAGADMLVWNSARHACFL